MDSCVPSRGMGLPLIHDLRIQNSRHKNKMSFSETFSGASVFQNNALLPKVGLGKRGEKVGSRRGKKTIKHQSINWCSGRKTVKACLLYSKRMRQSHLEGINCYQILVWDHEEREIEKKKERKGKKERKEKTLSGSC